MADPTPAPQQPETITQLAEAAMRALLVDITEAATGGAKDAKDSIAQATYIAQLAAAYESLCKGEDARPMSVAAVG